MDIFEELGVKKYINAHDTYTIYGGSRMSARTLKTMEEMAGAFVDMEELQRVLPIMRGPTLQTGLREAYYLLPVCV